MPSFNAFIQNLCQTTPPPNCINPYFASSKSNQNRRHNLQCYLREMQNRQPIHLLVGEAPGYRGCGQTGIPFVSPYLLVNGVPRFSLFGLEHGYALPEDCTAVAKEASATIVWQTLSSLNQLPLLWNAFPFHPHKANQPQSNRKPTAQELEMGGHFLREFMDLFGQPTVTAVGRQAETSLTNLNIPHQTVRHPSYGGKTQFAAGLKTVLS